MFTLDSKDDAIGKITGVTRENHEQIDQIISYFKDVKELVTDDNSAYKKYAGFLNAKHIHINSKVKHDPSTGQTINNVNSLMSDFDHYTIPFRGVSSRHLQGYIASFLFIKHYKYRFEENDLVRIGIRECLSVNTQIKNEEIRFRKFPVNLYEIFKGVDGWNEDILAEYYQ